MYIFEFWQMKTINLSLERFSTHRNFFNLCNTIYSSISLIFWEQKGRFQVYSAASRISDYLLSFVLHYMASYDWVLY